MVTIAFAVLDPRIHYINCLGCVVSFYLFYLIRIYIRIKSSGCTSIIKLLSLNKWHKMVTLGNIVYCNYLWGQCCEDSSDKL